jgi:hypothetical protein
LTVFCIKAGSIAPIFLRSTSYRFFRFYNHRDANAAQKGSQLARVIYLRKHTTVQIVFISTDVQ